MHKVVLVTAGEERLPAGTAEKIRDFEKNFFAYSVEKLRKICEEIG